MLRSTLVTAMSSPAIITVRWIIFMLINLSIYSSNCTSTSVMIYIDSSQSNCNPTSLPKTLVCNINITTNSDVKSYACPDLDSALEYITAANITNSSFAHICLPPGHSVLGKIWSLDTSVVFTGHNEQQSIIHCDYSDNQDVYPSNELEYTLFVKDVELVKFEFLLFDNCTQPLRIEMTNNVSIINCGFTGFSEAVLDIHNSAHVNISNTNFNDNVGTGNVFLPFRGNTGAVAVGYFGMKSVINPTILIENCVFTKNQAIATSSYTTSDIIGGGVFAGRGGGLGILINASSLNVTGLIKNCVFANNSASAFGGSIYVAFDGEETQHIISISNCNFINNTGRWGAGGIKLSYLTNGNRNFPMTTIVQNCYFEGNRGDNGAAIYVLPSSLFGGDGNVAYIENSYFERNEASTIGGAVAISPYSFFRASEALPTYHIVNCVFKRNSCPGGIVNIGYIPFALRGRNIFLMNVGPALRVIGCVVQIHDEVNFIENEVQDGGALYIDSFGQLRVFPEATISFERNIGGIGASIVVSSRTISPAMVYYQLLYNPLCFLLPNITSMIPFTETNDINITFADNNALEATAIFMRGAQQCSWTGNYPPYFDAASILRWPFLNIRDNLIKQQDVSPIETSISEINIPDDVTDGVWPGQILSLAVNITDEINQVASGFLQLDAVNNNDQSTTRYRVHPAVVYHRSNKLLNLTIVIENDDKYDTNITVVVRDFMNDNRSIASSITLKLQQCPNGYDITYDSMLGGFACKFQYYSDIRTCGYDDTILLIPDGQWVLDQPYIEQPGNLTVYPCPPGYCTCFQNLCGVGEGICSFAYFNGDPDKQCNCDREGYLCGDCKDNKGVSTLLNRCVDCGDINAVFLPALFIVDTTLIIVMLFKDFSFSTLLFPTIFFINMVSYVGENYPTSYDQVGQYVYFINSLLSLYFPYDFCLYSGATPFATYAFRYLPLCLTIIICSIGLILHQYFLKRVKRFSWNNLWLLLTLQYSHVVYTSMTILHCPQVINENGEHESRWFVKGTMECFTGYHIPLALCAIIVLVICTLLIPFLGLVATGTLTRPYIVRKLTKHLQHSFKQNLPWWCMVELGRKFVFLLLLIPFPQNTASPMLILMITFAVYAYMLPYKEMFVNIIELFFQLILLIFLMLRSTGYIIDKYLRFPNQSFEDDMNMTRCSSETGMANLTWILFPFAYLPLVVIIGIFSIKLLQRLWQCVWYRNIKLTEYHDRLLERESAQDWQVNVTHAKYFLLDVNDNKVDFVATTDDS